MKIEILDVKIRVGIIFLREKNEMSTNYCFQTNN